MADVPPPLEPVPFQLSWGEVDPRLHPFDRDSALAMVTELEPAGWVPVRSKGSTAGAFSDRVGYEWTNAMTRALAERLGSWAVGWRWGRDEAEIGGGPVASWCCPRASITTTEETLSRVTRSLCEWRDWLEDVAERFDRYPLGDLPAEDRHPTWERATTHLVTHVVDRTGAGDAWYVHCRQVLTWFLTRWDVAPETARTRVEQAIGGRFDSWIGPDRRTVEAVAERLAASLRADEDT